MSDTVRVAAQTVSRVQFFEATSGQQFCVAFETDAGTFRFVLPHAAFDDLQHALQASKATCAAYRSPAN
jgi:hypothetical protein